MIDRETILEVLVEPDDDTLFFGNACVIDGIIIIAAAYHSAVPVMPLGESLFKTIAVDSMLAYNFSKETCIKLNELGWFIKDEYLVIQL